MDHEQRGRLIRWLAGGLAFVLALTWYYTSSFRGLRHPEAVDQAQVARCLASGEGYSTRVVRPFEVAMASRSGQGRTGALFNYREYPEGPQPDVMNPPLYPALLALVFKVTGEDFKYDEEAGARTEVHGPEAKQAVLGLLLLVLAGVVASRLATELFDARVAIVALLLLAGTDVLLQLSVHGLPVPLLALLVVLAAWAWHGALRLELTPEAGSTAALPWVGAASVLQGLMTLTSYGWFWTIIPSGLLAWFAFRRRWAALLLVLAGGLLVPGVWFARNLSLTGNPLGSALWVIFEGTPYFPTREMWSNLRPDIGQVSLRMGTHKLTDNLFHWSVNLAAYAGGLLLVVMAAVSWLHPFRRRAAQLLKWWMGGLLLAVLVGVSLGPVRELDPLRADNSVAALAPLLAIFGSAALWLLVDRLELRFNLQRRALLGGLVAFQALPLIWTLLPPPAPFPYPPYYPVLIHRICQMFDRGDVLVSELPEGIAWYAGRTAVFTPRRLTDFYRVNDRIFPGRVKGLMLGREWLDARLVSELRDGGSGDWAALLVDGTVPEEFPLRAVLPLPPARPYYLLVADRARWNDGRDRPTMP
jgi:hypothetical protein